MYRSFFRQVLPAMLAFAFSGLYTIVDGFFIGRNVGDVGLAAVNIAYPLVALIQAAGTGIGMGGAIQCAVARGGDDKAREKACLGNTLSLLAAAAVILTAVLLLSSRPALRLLGADGEVLEGGVTYLRILAAGALFQLCATGFTPLLRNYDGAVTAMGAMIGGFVTNIALDALFVAALQFGIAGAAWATVIGQIVTVIPCGLFIVKKCAGIGKKAFRIRKKLALSVAAVGVSPFGLSISPFLVIILMNRGAIQYGGETAVAAYAVISYVVSITYLLLQGIGDGSQPLMSLYVGMGKQKEAGQARNLAYGFAGVVALGTMTAIIALRGKIPGFFGASGDTAGVAAGAFPVIAAGFLFVAFCRTTTAYFYAGQKNLLAYVMVYGEPVLLWGMLLIIPNMLGLQGVWLAAPSTQAVLCVVGLILLKRENLFLPMEIMGRRESAAEKKIRP